MITPNNNQPVDIEAIRQRVNRSTKGPWYLDRQERNVIYTDYDGDECVIASRPIRAEDAPFIAHSRQDIPALCDEVESLRKRIESFRDIEKREIILMATVESLMAEVKQLKASSPPPDLVWVIRKELAELDSLREKVKKLEETISCAVTIISLNEPPVEPTKGETK